MTFRYTRLEAQYQKHVRIDTCFEEQEFNQILHTSFWLLLPLKSMWWKLRSCSDNPSATPQSLPNQCHNDKEGQVLDQITEFTDPQNLSVGKIEQTISFGETALRMTSDIWDIRPWNFFRQQSIQILSSVDAAQLAVNCRLMADPNS